MKNRNIFLTLSSDTEATGANSTYPKGGVSNSADTFVVAESSVLRMKFSGKNPALRVAANRYKQPICDSAQHGQTRNNLQLFFTFNRFFTQSKYLKNLIIYFYILIITNMRTIILILTSILISSCYSIKIAEDSVNQLIFVEEYKKLCNDTYLYKDSNMFAGKGKVRDYLIEKNHVYVNTAGKNLLKLIYLAEEKTNYESTISAETRTLISRITEPYVLVLVERALKEDLVKDNIETPDSTYFFKYKILKEVSNQMNLIMKSKYPYYTYETEKKQPIKFFSVRTGNDLFTILPRNLDRDYTGSLLIELGTDYLNPLRRRPVKSYQTFLYGFDVFTPQFNDNTKFTKFDSQDSLDRPHASFQYFGWSKKALSKYGNMRWSTTLKFGKIGGRVGGQFQTALHQDISYSLRPKGWDAQIANGGRLGISIETKHEVQKQLNKTNHHANSFKQVIFIPSIELKYGTYMTNATFGVGLSNKKFNQNNHNFINHRTRQGTFCFFDHVMYNISFKATHVVHNTMLEGYGWVRTTEKDASKIDELTPLSSYVLEEKQVRKWFGTVNLSLSYTTRHFTVFYNYFIFTPETKLGDLKSTNIDYQKINLSKRVHRFAEIGISFNIR